MNLTLYLPWYSEWKSSGTIVLNIKPALVSSACHCVAEERLSQDQTDPWACLAWAPSWFSTEVEGWSPLWAAPFPGGTFLGCIRKQAKHKQGKRHIPHGFWFKFLLSSCLTSLIDSNLHVLKSLPSPKLFWVSNRKEARQKPNSRNFQGKADLGTGKVLLVICGKQ